MNSTILILALITFASTLLGGLIIFKFRKNLHYFFAFAAGSLIAVSLLDLLPESIELSKQINFPIRNLMIIVVCAFFLYSLLERFFATHELEHSHDEHGHVMGPIGAGSLILHSFFDGVAIGAAFHVSFAIGLIVAFAVIAHDFTDGINTVIIMLKNKHTKKTALTFLLLDALAPVVGIIATSAIFVPQKALAIILAIFVGEFLYIGASTLLPETKKHPSKGMLIAMALGIGLIIVVTSLIA
ncbi:MAG: ZIP family metal transporter [candidate division SR1 bacterium]|nr:ZIP family metal transporter [candidate division SR1 bacterium]